MARPTVANIAGPEDVVRHLRDDHCLDADRVSSLHAWKQHAARHAAGNADHVHGPSARPSIARQLSPADRRLIVAGVDELAKYCRGYRDYYGEDTEVYAALDTAVDRIEHAARCIEAGE